MASKTSTGEALRRDYAKWDKLAEEIDNENATGTTYFHNPDIASYEIIDQHLWSYEDLKLLRQKEQREKEIWQLLIKPLRAWTAASKPDHNGNEIPCRPYCMFLLDLYPKGSLYMQKFCDPVENLPNAKMVLNFLYNAITNPPEDTDSQHRPSRIVFADKTLASMLHKSLSEINIECGYLTEVPSIHEVVTSFSDKLIEKEMASRAQINTISGLCKQINVTNTLFSTLWHATQAFYQSKPWLHTPERMAFRLRAPTSSHVETISMAGQERVWGAILGRPPIVDDSDEEPPQVARGLCLFWNRWDAEQRMMTPMDGTENTTMIANAVPHIYDMKCANSACDMSAQPNATTPLKRCARCRAVYYCSRDCQKADWARHAKDDCYIATPTRRIGEVTWGKKELTVLFVENTGMPFDDLDTAHALGLSTNQPDSYPFPVLYTKGTPERPGAYEIIWLIRALRALARFCSKNAELVAQFRPTESYEHIPCTPLTEESEIASQTTQAGAVGTTNTNDALESDIDSIDLLLDPMMTQEERTYIDNISHSTETSGQLFK